MRSVRVIPRPDPTGPGPESGISGREIGEVYLTADAHAAALVAGGFAEYADLPPPPPPPPAVPGSPKRPAVTKKQAKAKAKRKAATKAKQATRRRAKK